jgi:hypothetical protein
MEARMSNNTDHSARWLLLQVFTVVSLILSYFLIVSGLINENTAIFEQGDVNTIVPVGGYGVLVVGLLLLGVNLYALKITDGWGHWRDLRNYKKALTALPIITGIGAMVFVCLLCLAYQALSE